MSSRTQKNRSVKQAISDAVRDKAAAEFVAAFYHLAPEEDLAGAAPEALCAIAESMYEWARVRKPGTHKVRVLHFAQEEKPQVPSTVVQIVNDDMPFIVDSVSADLAFQGLRIDVLHHPILNVSRDAQGRLRAAGAGKGEEKGPLIESFIHIRLEQVLSEPACRELEERLSGVLDDVRAVTQQGWRDMLKQLDEIISATPQPARPNEDFSEALAFLSYIRSNNFTFLGYRRYSFAEGVAKAVKGSDLGYLRIRKEQIFGAPGGAAEIAALRKTPGPVMVGKLVDLYSYVHRRVPMDAVFIKIFDKAGNLSGMHVFTGLFTSSTYSCRTVEVPIIRKKVRDTVQRAGFPRNSHDQKALEHILEKLPRDEMFRVSGDELYHLALGILRLQEKHSTALFTHMDPTGQYMCCLVYVPRDRYNTRFRLQAGRILEAALPGQLRSYFTTLDDSPLARLLFTIRLGGNKDKDFDAEAAAHQLAELARDWDERLKHILISLHGKVEGMALSDAYGRAFPTAYQDSIDIGNAPHDIRQIEALLAGTEEIRVDLYRLHDAPPGDLRLKVYHRGTPAALHDIMPLLENMGLEGISEMPYKVTPAGRGTVWIHDFHLKGPEGVVLENVKDGFEDAFVQVWHGRAENDGLNALVLNAGLAWHEVRIIRTFNAFLRQARFPYSRPYIEQTLNAHPLIVREIVALFMARHDPALSEAARAKKSAAASARIDDLIQKVEKLDHDRILRAFRTLVEKTLRVNYWQRDAEGRAKPCLAVKLDSKGIDFLPQPRPHVEIFVYSARVEAVHLRGGAIARGGIRWSDRNDDFRTEVLGLMKAQMVKNAVIVPVGAKGGFIVKQPPKTGGPAALRAEAVECYKTFVRTLLDMTDNMVKGGIVRPKDIVSHDGPDPYLVVAADKGTAKFSDIANAVSAEAGFWLGDAFASGGSTGYDHKEIGITARGGWESVTRHFRELGKDIAREEFTAVGVGDMSGDVFGNAMLLSKKMKLVAAFNHIHIFCDPEPDLAASFAERERLFHAAQGWDAYDRSKLSPGGAIFERSAKVLKLTPQIRKLLGLDQAQASPDEVVRAILKKDADLLWFGGIGTFVKSSHQSHSDADDKANDAVRVDGSELRAKVVGEGANLGMTQLGRVQYARHGGRLNTDFIDNSGGVDCSDHEVNIKILLSGAVASGKMSLPQRNKLLEQMTEEVAAHVLRDNYQQAQSLSLQEFMAPGELMRHAELIRQLEKAGLFSRRLQGLPDDETLALLARERRGLTRPELCELTSWAKIALLKKVVASGIPDDPSLEGLLFDYFPKPLHKFAQEIRSHRLRREIIATQVCNMLVNRMGAVFVRSRVEKTGDSEENVVKAFVIVVEAFGLRDIWRNIEALDGKVPAQVQIAALHEVFKLAKRAVTWLLRFGAENLEPGAEIAALKSGIAALKAGLPAVLSEGAAEDLRVAEARIAERGIPPALASELAALRLFSGACDIIHIARRAKKEVRDVAKTYFIVGERAHIDWLRAQVSAMEPANTWQARVIGSLLDDYYVYQATIASRIVAQKKAGGKDLAQAWFARHAEMLARLDESMDEIRSQPKVELEMLILAGQRLAQAVHGTQG